jgi:hypothetical protein
MASPELSADLTKKMGPLPVWAWALLVGGGLGFYFYYQRTKSGTVNTAASTATSADAGFGTTRPGLGNLNAGGTDTSVTTTTGLQTNQQWSVKAQSILISYGYDPATVSIALANYLGGNDLTAQQQAIVSEALRAAGPTPEPVPPAVNPQPGPTPIVPADSNLWDVWKTSEDTNLNAADQNAAAQYDWGEIARNTLTASATKNDVYYRSIALQQKYPDVAKKYPFYVPVSVAKTLTYP